VEVKRIFVSDVHMGTGRSFQRDYKGHAYDWLCKDEASAFADFLNYLNSSDADEIILLGDIMDNWVCPIDSPPPDFTDIVAAGVNKEIVRNLKILSSNKNTIYVPGNHDMSVNRTFLSANFPGILLYSEYRSDDIFAVHGSEYTMFCASDLVNDTVNHLPIGYYISRVAATNAAMTGSDNSFQYYIENFLKEIVGSKTLIEAVFSAIVDEADLNDHTGIMMEHESISIGEVKERYANLYSQWDAGQKIVPAKEALLAEINSLWPVPWTLNKLDNYKIIILGHTHERFLGKFPVQDAAGDMYIYANTGAWCEYEKKKDFTFVETEKNDGKGKHFVRLKAWDRGNKQPDGIYEDYVEL
jgi:UDP-2,3-diacylglucosamine pyrophosphatase LpxH